MTSDTDLRAFLFSAMVPAHQQEWALRVARLEDRLNEEINLADYTDAIRTIYFLPISADLPDAETFSTYEPETGVVEIRVVMEAGEELLEVLVRELEFMLQNGGNDLPELIQALRKIDNPV